MHRCLRISLIFRTGMALALIGLAGACSAADLERMFPRAAASNPAPEPEPAPQIVDMEPSAGGVRFPPPRIRPEQPARPERAESRPSERADRVQPAQLVGIGQDDATRMLGLATSVREVPPATVWEYRSEGCALDLFFYMDLQEKRFRTLAYDIKTSNGDRAEALENCLDRIRNMRRDS